MPIGCRSTRARYLSALITFLFVGLALHHSQTVVAQQTWSLPAPWNAQDVGAAAIAGSASFDQTTGTFGITAAGTGIGGRSDQFTFIYQQVTGDVEVIAKVDSVSAADGWSNSGVMIRSSLAANAGHGYALVSAGHGVAFQRRQNDGGRTNLTYGPSVSAPYWVRLVREGTTLTSYSSADGATWATLTSRTVSLGTTAYVGIATTSNNGTAPTNAAVSHVSIAPLSLPAPQKAVDIGAPSIAGSTAYDQGVYRVHAGGADIWGTSDQFHFVYQPMNGDGEVVAHVQSLSNSNAWAKTGVMIRETLAPDSRHAFALVSAASGYGFQRRIDPVGMSQLTSGTATQAPGWVRLVRTGTRFDAYQSTDGSTWRLMGSDAVAMADAVYVGIATTSHNTSTATDAVLDSFKVTQGGSTANQPPTVAVTAPADGSTFTMGNTITMNAAANDTDGTVTRVDFRAGTTVIGSSTASPYSVTWSPAAAGTYSLTAVATDSDGAATTSAAVSIRVEPAANQPPSVSLTAPANGASYTAPASISLAATASDPENSLSRVEFYNGTTLLGSDTTAPYSYSWASVPAGTYTLKAVAYDNAGASASSATAAITVGPGSGLPSPWTAVDLGNPALKGSTAYNNGVFSIDAGGADIWGTSDQFQFVYRPMNGDGEVVAHVQSLFNSNTWAKTGVMIRETLAPDSRHAFALVSAASGYGFQRRIDPAGISQLTGGTATQAPGWVRLVRTGSRIDAYQSTDGSTWSAIGSDTVAMADAVYVGIATTSHNTSTATHAVLDSFKVTQGGSTANQPPTVTLTSPASGATFTAPATVTLSANATDSDGTIARVEFYSGTTLLNSDTAAPYAFTWSSVPAGTYSVKAIAYDNSGASASSATVTVTVSATANKPPTVTLTSPTSGATFTAPANVTLSANATDSDGTIARVEFYNGTTLLNSDTAAPYSFTWSSVPAGTYSVKAIAYDNSGASASSATVTVTVSGAANKPPTVTLTSPSSGATFTAPANVTLSANATDSDGTIARVEFYNGTTLLNSDTTAPYTFAWSSVPAGAYTVKAIAYDNSGASTTSAVSTITVTATTTLPTGVVFTASPDHATLVTRYELRIYASGADPNTATPVATSNLGKPTPDVNNDITVSQPAFFSALAPSNYVAAVAAIGSGGSSLSTAVTFVR